MILLGIESVDCQCIERQLLCPNKFQSLQRALVLRFSELCLARIPFAGKIGATPEQKQKAEFPVFRHAPLRADTAARTSSSADSHEASRTPNR
jgi:hypothetical protein